MPLRTLLRRFAMGEPINPTTRNYVWAGRADQEIRLLLASWLGTFTFEHKSIN
jgi:hypothetical protein